MNVEQAIKQRRSIRKYLDKEVNIDTICQIIEAARFAPSSGNIQNWRIVIVMNEQKRRDLATASLKQMWMTQAPVHLVICNIKSDVKRMHGDRGELYSIQNCSALIQNILLMATEKKLSSCWVGAFDRHAISRILKIPDNIEPEAIITLGHNNETLIDGKRQKTEFISFFEEYGNRKKDFGVFPLEKHIKKAEKVRKKSQGFLGRLKEKIKH